MHNSQRYRFRSLLYEASLYTTRSDMEPGERAQFVDGFTSGAVAMLMSTGANGEAEGMSYDTAMAMMFYAVGLNTPDMFSALIKRTACLHRIRDEERQKEDDMVKNMGLGIKKTEALKAVAQAQGVPVVDVPMQEAPAPEGTPVLQKTRKTAKSRGKTRATRKTS